MSGYGVSKIKIGLEIHIQLSGKKLFCSCQTEGYNFHEQKFSRALHTVSGESGHTDPAVIYERIRNRTFTYLVSSNSCLVEADEEPPHDINVDALEKAIAASLALGCTVLPTISYMRKIVVDGSNTSGFQRTAIVGVNGMIGTSKGGVRISNVCLEEDSCRKIDEASGSATYGLDRLGVPLLEISTEPDIVDSDHAVEVAEKIGGMLIYAGWVRKGPDSIRQDVNFSMGFGRVEIKGVQKLTDIRNAIEAERERQEWISELRNRIGNISGKVIFNLVDAEEVFKATGSRILQRARASGLTIYASRARSLRGYLKSGKFRLGRELSEVVKVFGGGGLVHSDELPAFGITESEVAAVRALIKAEDDDAFLVVSCASERKGIVEEALNSRFRKLLMEDLSETRWLTPEGITGFLRPLPGGERMYPETDVPLKVVGPDLLDHASARVPKDPSAMVQEIAKRFNISNQDADTIASAGLLAAFEKISMALNDTRLAARIVTQILPELERERGSQIQESEAIEFLDDLAKVTRDRPSIELALRMRFLEGMPISQILRSERIKPLSRDEIAGLIRSAARKGNLTGSNLIPMLKSMTSRTFDPKLALDVYHQLEKRAHA